jgi:hypothetical protein
MSYNGFVYKQDDIHQHEVKIKELSVGFDGTFYGRIITVYVYRIQRAFELLSNWNCGASTHKYIDGCKLPIYQYSIEM